MFSANFQTLAELCSSGKSGSFFYFTQDSKFVLKTIPREEFKFMKKILRPYHEYLTQRNPDTLMSKIYGIHKVIFHRKLGNLRKKYYFCIMDNLFNTRHKIDLRYDLKGSTYGRKTINDGGVVDRTIALKDLDLLERKEIFKIGHENYRRLMQLIKMDAEFF